MRLPVYLDYAATTPVDPDVVAAMAAHLGPDSGFGNPASPHAHGRFARAAVDRARGQVAALLNADPQTLVWTSGATESNNLAIKGAARAYARRGRHIVTAKTEHKAVLDVCRELGREGFDITYLDPRPDGRLDPERLGAALRDDTVLVSLMHVNNETGVTQDLAALGGVVKGRGALFHVDAAQSVGKLPLDLARLPVDLMSLSAHKIYGPKGIGALYVRRRPRVRLDAQLHGGGQERGLRAGTLATHQIVAMGAALELAGRCMASDQRRIADLRDRLWDGLRDLDGIERNGHPRHRVAGILNISIAGLHGEALLADLPDLSLAFGSACTAADPEPSHVLRAMGRSDSLIRSTLRLSLGRFTTRDEVDFAVGRLREAIIRLRALSPLWPPRQQISV